VAEGQIPKFHLGEDRQQLGGDIVVDPSARVALIHIETGPENRPPAMSLIDRLEEAVSSG
jgi:hypothetical protein